MDVDPAQDVDARIALLEAELWQLKRQRAQQAGRPVKALDGIRVLDLSRFIFGPFCTQMLADMGAEVIKIEPIGTGDPARKAGIVSVNGVSASFLARNRNKRRLCLDLRKPAGQEIALRLVDREPLAVSADDDFVQLDIRHTDSLTSAFQGARAVVHLAAISDEADFRSKLLPMNVDGVYSVFNGGNGDAATGNAGTSAPILRIHSEALAVAVPEAGSMALFGAGLIGAGLMRRRKVRGA